MGSAYLVDEEEVQAEEDLFAELRSLGVPTP
jgi:hypothetical protein